MSNKTQLPFDAEEFQKFLDANCFKIREKWKEFTKDPIFTPKFGLSLRQQKDLALERLKVVAKNKVFSVFDFDKDPLRVFANHEMAGWVDGSLGTKLTVQYNLFGGTVLTLGTSRHVPIAEGVNTLDTIGCFALTELGFGNNAVQMETTAHWDNKAKEFIINSPTSLSQKYWITNGALHCNFAVVFAQLIMPPHEAMTNNNSEGKSVQQGIHAFLVRMRNEDGTVKKGIEIEDMGEKFGLNGVDNARIRFSNVRIPRENMLNKFSDVSETGQFSSQIEGRRSRFLKVADRLLSGRLCIAAMLISASKLCFTIALRFASRRMAMGNTGLSDTAIIEFNLFQTQLYPLLARTICLNIAFNRVKELYSKALLSGKEMSQELICLCCAIKPLAAWNCRDVGTTIVERLGGQGFLAINRVCELLPFAHAGITSEGDSSVLMQKVAKELATSYGLKTYQAPKTKKQREQLIKTMVFSETDVLLDLIYHREVEILNELINTTKQKIVEGKSIYDVWMFENSDLVQALSRAYAERVVAQFCYEQIKQAHSNIRYVLTQYLHLYLQFSIINNIQWYFLNEYLSKNSSKALHNQYKATIKVIHLFSLKTVNSFGIPDHLLTAPIAHDYIKHFVKKSKDDLQEKSNL